MARVRVVKKEHADGSKEFHENLRIDTRTQIYWWDEMIQGRHYRKSTGEKTIKKAQTQIQKFRMKAGKVGFDRRVKFDDAFKLALDLKKRKAKKTFKEAEQGDRRLREFFDDSANGSIYLDQFVARYEMIWNKYTEFAYAKNLENLGRRGSLLHDRKHLLYVLGRAYNNSWVTKRFTAKDFALEKYETNSGRALSDLEVNELLRISLEVFENERLHLQIFLAATTGMRRGEILGLQVSEVNFTKGTFVLNPKRIKTRTKRKLAPFIPPEAIPTLKKYCAEAKAHRGTCIFPQRPLKGGFDYSNPQSDFSNDWNRVKEKAGVYCDFKDLRATVITNMVKERIPPTTIAAYLGNSLKMIMEVYDQVHNDLRDEVRTLFVGRFLSKESAK